MDSKNPSNKLNHQTKNYSDNTLNMKGSPINNNNPFFANVLYINILGEIAELLNISKARSALNDIIHFIIHLLMNNKKASILGLCVALAFLINYRLTSLKSRLIKRHCWSQWRSYLTLEELYAVPRKTLYKDLLTSIQTKYINFKTLKDNLAPLSCFLKDVELEEEYIRKYCSFLRLLSFCHITGFSWLSHAFYKQLNKRSKRLRFIKKTFLEWYAEHKLNNSEKEMLARRFPKTRNILESTIKLNQPVTAMQPKGPIKHILEKVILSTL